MNIHDEAIALDTNEFIFALRQDTNYATCETLLLEKLPELKIYVPLQVLIELQRNLTESEMRGILIALSHAKETIWDYTPAPLELVKQWEKRGAKKGDAVIAAHLEAHQVRYLISENRHFLTELSHLPFTVLTSANTLRLLEENKRSY